MSLRVVIAGIVGLTISIAIVVMLVGTGGSEALKNPNNVTELRPTDVPLPIAKSGPQPKVSVPETEFPFGRMEVGESRTHDFVFTNVGAAPLTIKMGETTCQCTYGNLKKGEERKILPGESQKIKLTWKPESINTEFSKGADIWTDDPDPGMQKISLRVVGKVGARISVSPQREWPCSDVTDDTPVICTGFVSSGVLEKFQVTSVESRGAPMEFELKPLEGDDLTRHQASFGYEVRLTVKPDMQMGAFVFPVTVKTDVIQAGEDGAPGKPAEFEVLIAGIRRGPIRLAGPDWIEEKMAVRMGAFEAAAGKKLSVPVFVRNPPSEGFRLTKPPEVTPLDLKVELVPDDKSAGKTQRFLLKLEFPAGLPRADYRGQEPGKIRLFTNHPNSPEIEILVYLSTY